MGLQFGGHALRFLGLWRNDRIIRVRRKYRKQMGADITIVAGGDFGEPVWAQPPSVDWERDWGYLLGF